MLKSTVPTPVTTPVDAGGVASASSTNTSSSGNAKATDALQLRPISSSQWPVAGLNSTTSPVLGAFGVEPAGGGGSPPLLVTTCSVIAVVRLPDSRTAAYTTVPSGLAASARGVSPNNCTIASGAPPAPSAAKTHTSARPTPGAVTLGPPAASATERVGPGRAAVTKARP